MFHLLLWLFIITIIIGIIILGIYLFSKESYKTVIPTSINSTKKFNPGLNYDNNQYVHPKHIKNFITEEEANILIELARPRLGPAQVRQYSTDTKYRKGQVAWINESVHPVIKKIRQKVSTLSGFPVENMEQLQVGHYNPGDFFKPHYDQCESNQQWCHNTTYPRGGPRIYTFLMYLNNNFDGGYTHFTKLNKKYKLNKGDVIWFHNLDKQQQKVHHLSMHEGTALEGGQKWIATVWVRENKFH